MTRETMYAKSAYIYQLDLKNPQVIQRKLNRPYARWEKEWRVFASQTAAKLYLIRTSRAAAGTANLNEANEETD